MKNDTAPIRVGVIGANPRRGWAYNAHLPALDAMDAYEIAAVSTRDLASASETARRYGVPEAYDDWRRIIDNPAINLVSVCVKVSHHCDMVLAAVEAGKHVYCEWPLGLNTAEAETMRDAARRKGVTVMVGLQGRGSPGLNTVRRLIAESAIGDVISASFIASLANWGPSLPQAEAYRADRRNGATGLTVPGGHSLDCLRYCLGAFSSVSSNVVTRHERTKIIETGEVLAVTSPDQVVVNATMKDGAVLSAHIKADMANPTGVVLEINGTEGDIIAESRPAPGVAPVGLQRADLSIRMARGRSSEYQLVASDPDYFAHLDDAPSGAPRHTGALYARLAQCLREEKPADPDFSTALSLHRLLDSIENASATGQRQTVGI